MATHRLERDAAAEAEARALMARIRAAGRLDFDRDVPDPRFGVETMYEPGGGKMLGVLLAERAETSPGSTRHSTLDATREAGRATSTKASNATKEIVVLKAFSGQMRGEWRVPGWAPPLCALTHDAPRYAEAHEKIAAATAAARARSAAVAEMEARLMEAREPWDARIREAAETAKEARRARRARRRAQNAQNAQNAPTSARDARDDARQLAFETQLAEESRAGKREMARLREARAAATAPLESALAAAREEVRGLRDAHRSMSATLLDEIFDSYRLPNFREAFGFGDRVRKRADTGETQLAGLEGLEGLENLEGLETRAREAPGATLAECFVADEAAAARAAEGSAEVSAEVSAARASLPCGCGDCCAPKLLAECALRGLKPLSIAEVWMGVSTRGEGDREEGEFYGACRGRCRPILGHMLCGADALEPRTKEKLGGPIVL